MARRRSLNSVSSTVLYKYEVTPMSQSAFDTWLDSWIGPGRPGMTYVPMTYSGYMLTDNATRSEAITIVWGWDAGSGDIYYALRLGNGTQTGDVAFRKPSYLNYFIAVKDAYKYMLFSQQPGGILLSFLNTFGEYKGTVPI